MQEVGKVESPSPDIVMIQAQGRDSDAVHLDVQNARWAIKEANQMHCLARASTVPSPLKDKLLTMCQQAHDDRAKLPGNPNPDPAAPCPIP